MQCGVEQCSEAWYGMMWCGVICVGAIRFVNGRFVSVRHARIYMRLRFYMCVYVFINISVLY